MKTLAAVSCFGLVALVGVGARAQAPVKVIAPAVAPSVAPAAPGAVPTPAASATAPAAAAASPAEAVVPAQVPPAVGAQDDAAARALNPPPPPGEAAAELPPAPQVIEEEANGREDGAADPFAADIDNDVAYDDSVAQSYDDGYDPQAYRQFEPALAPYGNWVDDDTYGRVWQPSSTAVGADFSPYATNGDWAMTEYGWTWVSAFDWGWAPFHYGRWARMATRGWCWVPGTIWSPAQVAWRAGAGFVGWAPLAPRHVTMGAPFSPRSPWRFEPAGSLGHAHGPFLTARAVPRVFGRMSVVSNGRNLAIGGSTVRVNAGPVWVGRPPGATEGAAPVRMAQVAPRALPRIAIQPHAGTPLLARPWVLPGVARTGYAAGAPQTAYNVGAGRAFAPGTRTSAPIGGGFYGGGRGASYAPGRVYGRSTVVMPGFRPGPARSAFSPSFSGGGRPAFGGAPFRGAPPMARGFGGGGRGFSAPSFSRPSGSAFHGAPVRSSGGFGGGGFGGRRR